MELAVPIAFLGLSNSGKTALIRSSLSQQQQIFPTAGLQINYITSTSRTLLVYDCSGEGSARSNWTLLSTQAESLVFVIDAVNTGTFHSAKKALYSFLQKHTIMKQKNLCIMLNKCDRKHRPSKELLVKALQPEKISKFVNKYYIKETSAFHKEGIEQCLEWLIKNSKNQPQN